MLINRDGISNDVITLDTCFLMLVLIRADWRKSDSTVDGEPQGNWNSRDIKLSFLFPLRRQSVPEILLEG